MDSPCTKPASARPGLSHSPRVSRCHKEELSTSLGLVFGGLGSPCQGSGLPMKYWVTPAAIRIKRTGCKCCTCYTNFARDLLWRSLRKESERRKAVWICLLLKKISVLADTDTWDTGDLEMDRGITMVNQTKQQCNSVPGTITRSWLKSFSSLSRLCVCFLSGKQQCPKGNKHWIVPGGNTKRRNKYHFPKIRERGVGGAA